ncbi:MAG: hypothetical protein OMM_03997 [Candidatus Magnetoglobus multicellularis str. Araruama]|uniref:Peptidase C-terminal archaeal/bacterial domain-containing protein n=1 Tax=Candidatus Magnetoglobus multicellularis str. Araruama TaxID=890399 RepID=A0A1V1P360_9BACT|nr:MAG: hypothetical protein OMM_03997 [Candidatus Magnetoglobus multicellularis str. Araruama]
MDWIHVISEKSGTGPAMIRFQIDENTGSESRSGKLDIANCILTIEQESPCTFNISPLKQTVAAFGGINQITITASLAACQWSIESLVPWIIPIEPLRAGSGVLNYSVTKNPLMNKRTGKMVINGTTVTVIQNASEVSEIVLLENQTHLKNISLLLGERLYYKIEIPSDSYSFQITTNGGTGDCDIYVSHGQVPTEDIYDHSSSDYGNDENILISKPAAGDWYIVLYAYERFQNLNFGVSYQSYQCEYTLSNTSFTFGSEHASGSFQVVTNELCFWQVKTDNSWIEIVNSAVVYQGNATISFNLLENISLARRVGIIEVADQSIEITQAGNQNTGVIVLENKIPQSNLSGTEFSHQYFKIIVPDNQEELLVKTWGGTGDCDIYLQFNEIPDLDNSDYISDNYSNSEIISIQSPLAGEYYVLVYGYSAYDDVTLQAEFQNTPCTYSFSQTEINVDSAETTGQIIVTTGDKCSWQAISLDDWITVLSESTITGSGTIHYTVSANDTNTLRTGGIEIADTLIFINQESSLEVVALSDNTPLTGLSVLKNDALFFVIDVPANQKNLMIDTWNGSGDVDLYAHYGRVPDDIIPDYECYAWGNDENIYIQNPDEGRWYIMIVGFENSDNVSLKATYSTVNCHYQITPMQKTMDVSGGTDYLNIVVNEGCSWTAIKHGTWIEIDESTRRGFGNGYVRYTVTTNESESIRTNNLRVADQWISVVQSGTEQLSPIVLTPNMPITIAGDEGTLQYYQINIPEETHLSFMMSGGTGDCDLYIRHEAYPTYRIYDFRPYFFGNDESVIIDNASIGTWIVMIHGSTDFADAQLQVNYGNNNENLANLIRVLQALSGIKISAMDSNSNGRIDIGDAIMILNSEVDEQPPN